MRSYVQSLNGLEKPLPPENEYLYRTKPLPPPPTTHRDASRSTPSLHSTPSRSIHSRQSSDPPPRPLPLVLPPPRSQNANRLSLPSPPNASSNARRRSSSKLSQLTGHDVGTYDYTPPRRILPASAPSPTDTSSSHSQLFESPIMEEDIVYETTRYSQSSGPPPLEPDCDDASSKRSSGGPKSPRPVQFSSPSVKPLPQMHYNSAPGSFDHVPGLHVSFPEDSSWRASKSYTYFSDAETAEEYHRFTSDLATLPMRRSGISPTMTPSQGSFSSRLSMSAKSLFSRRRDRPGSIESRGASFSSAHRLPKSPYSRNNSVTSDTNMASPPRSVFESDDDEDHHVREAIKDLFTRRSEDRMSVNASIQRTPPPPRPERPSTPSIFARTGGQMKGLLATAKDGAKSMHTSRAEKRRNELRSKIRVIPEVNMEENMI